MKKLLELNTFFIHCDSFLPTFSCTCNKIGFLTWKHFYSVDFTFFSLLFFPTTQALYYDSGVNVRGLWRSKKKSKGLKSEISDPLIHPYSLLDPH